MAGFGVVQQVQVTADELKQRFPQKKNTITEETVALVNTVISNPEFDGSQFLNHLVDYQYCMVDGGYSMAEYINAMKFCAYLESTGGNVTEAYKKARASDPFVAARLTAATDSNAYNELSSQASRYRRSKLVKQILTQSDMPLYLMFQAERYKAVAVLAREMQSAPFSKDRITAAKELLAAVKPPENIQIELGVGPTKEARDLQMELNTQLTKLAINQQALLDAGMDIRDVQKTGINLNIIEDAEIENG